MATTLTNDDWDTLLDRIRTGECTPFIGAGVNHGVLPLGSDIACRWAQKYGYPLEDCHDLARVAEYLAVARDKMRPKELIRREFEGIAPPDFTAPDDCLGVLADLPLPVYLTTNYDDFMVRALRSRKKDPRQELCVWNSQLEKKFKASLAGTTSTLPPTPANPVVFHLHGHSGVLDSMVLTESDYLDFLVYISTHSDLLPPRIQEALTGASLLFIGYRLADWDFRVIFRSMVLSMEDSLRRMSVAVQLVPDNAAQGREEAIAYLTKYFGNMEIRIYWGTAKEFAAELRERWRAFSK
jgi:hypothetical protein